MGKGMELLLKLLRRNKMDQPIWNQQTSAYLNKKLFLIKALSGYRAGLMDPLATDYCLAPDCADAELGQAVLNSLAESRALTIEEDYALYLNDSYYPKWLQSLMDRYGYKTKYALFKGMKRCGITLNGNMITIRPSRHERADSWSGEGITKEEHVHISADSSPEEIGAALRLGFSRCIG